MARYANITAIGGYVPPDVLTNFDLEQMVETSDEWIRARTGIEERRILKGRDQGSSVMAIKAMERLLAQRELDPTEIDLLICATVTPDMPFPATANLITAEIGATRAFGFDVQAACSGFLYALAVGGQFIETGKYQKVAVVGVDKMSSIIDYEDRNTCVIFGDGAGAVLLEPGETYGLIDGVYYGDGNGAQFLHQKAGGSRRQATAETVRRHEHFVYQDGKPVFKEAVMRMAEAAVEVMERNNLSAEDVNYLVAHQANKRIIDACRSRMNLAEEKVMMIIHRYGNTTAGTIPLLLWDWRHVLKPGNNLVLATFGGGFSWGASYVKWGIEVPE